MIRRACRQFVTFDPPRQRGLTGLRTGRLGMVRGRRACRIDIGAGLRRRRVGIEQRWFSLLCVSVCFLAMPAGCSDRAEPGEVLGVFGETGMGESEFAYARAIAVSPDGRVFVADKSGRIQRFGPGGEFQHLWWMPEWKQGKPTGMTFHPDGRLFVADTHYSRVMVFDADGNELARFGSLGERPGQFRLPTDIAIDADGFIYVGEYGGNDRISKFTPAFEYVLSFPGPASGEAALSPPSGLAFDDEQTLWVADTCNHRVCRFDRDGKLLLTFGAFGREPGRLSYPHDVVVLSNGTLLVTEYGNNRLQRFDRQGKPLGTWGQAGREPGELNSPWELDVSKDGRVYVVDARNNRVQIVAM